MAKKKVTPKKSTTKSKSKRGSALAKPLTPSASLAAITGTKQLARTAAVKKIWAYIKSHKLQDKNDGRIIHADSKLKPVFGKDKVNMMELGGILSKHLK